MAGYTYSLSTSNFSEGFKISIKDGCFLCLNKCQKWPRIHLRASRPVELPGTSAAPGPPAFWDRSRFSGFFPSCHFHLCINDVCPVLQLPLWVCSDCKKTVEEEEKKGPVLVIL